MDILNDKTQFLSNGLFRWNKDEPSSMDIQKIEQKIKKIYKQKKYKENFKKIEELENIYETFENNGGSRRDGGIVRRNDGVEERDVIIPINKENISHSNLQDPSMFSNNDSMILEKEGFTFDVSNLSQNKCKKKVDADTDHTTNPRKENIEESFAMKDMEKDLNYLIDKLWEGFAYIFYYSSIFITDVFVYVPYKTRETIHAYSRQVNKYVSVESKEVKERDSQTITDIIMKLIIFPLCVIISYNWYYLDVMYKEDEYNKAIEDAKKAGAISPENNIKPIVFRDASDINRLKITWGDDDYLNFFLYFVIKPLELVDSFLFGDKLRIDKNIYFLTEVENGYPVLEVSWCTLPYFLNIITNLTKMTGVIPSRMTNKLIIFFFSLVFIYQFSFFSIILDSLDTGKTTALKLFCTVYILFFYFYYTIKYCIFHIPKQLNMSNIGFIIKSIMIYITWVIIYSTIRLSIALASVNLSAMVICLYVWFNLMFGLMIYDKNNGGLLSGFDKINNFINSEIDSMAAQKECYNDKGFLNYKVAFRFIAKFVIFINDNLVIIGLLFLLGANYFEAKDIVSETVRNGLVGVLFLIAVINIYMFVLPSFKTLFSKKSFQYSSNPSTTYFFPDGSPASTNATPASTNATPASTNANPNA